VVIEKGINRRFMLELRVIDNPSLFSARSIARDCMRYCER
jgi:hypothetical protein